MKLSAEEQSIVETVRDFVDRDVKPEAQHLDHTNTYP
ncbi:MAG: acyl-CoA dehydrogenase family protein, partial [Actinomycetota bacterium]|nr:acyl-CoA dehydrogenase family protein [Actinomycetota bacterium]